MCPDHDECEEESCVGGVCVNTVGSYYCSCAPPLVLDDTQRNCVNSSHLTVGKTPPPPSPASKNNHALTEVHHLQRVGC